MNIYDEQQLPTTNKTISQKRETTKEMGGNQSQTSDQILEKK